MSITTKLSAIKKSVEKKTTLANEKRSHDELVAQLKEQKQILENVVKSINNVDNSISLKDYPDKIEVSNFPQQKAVEVKKPSWLKQFSLNDLLGSLSEMLTAFGSRRFNVNLDEYRSSKNAISVRLSDGQAFINQLAGAVGMAGGGRDVVFPEVQKVAVDNTISIDTTGLAQNETLINGTQNTNIKVQDSFSIDAFGRWRISDTGQRFDCEFLYDKQPSLMDEVLAGAGTVTHNASSRDLTLAVVDAVDASSAMMVQHWHNPYTPGNSQLIDITGTMDAANLGTGTASIVLRDGITSTEVVVNQADWDSPNLDLDWTTSQILQIDFQSLKVGRLRINLVRGGIPIQVHEIHNDNERIEGYWQYAALPVFWRIYNEGGATISEMGYGDDNNGIFLRYTIPTANATAKLQAICTTVKSEGGDKLLDMVGYTRSADRGITPVTVGTTLIPVISIRPSATFNSIENRGLIIPEGFEIATNNAIRYVWLLKPTLTGAVFNSVGAGYSATDVDTTATAVTGGIPIASGYVSTGRNTQAGAQGLLGRAPLSLGNTGTADILTLAAVRSGGNNAAVLASVNWKEIR